MASALPKQVQDQIKLANSILDRTIPRDEDDEEGAKPVETKQPEPEKKPEPAAPPPESDAEHKYKVLQGKYNKEVPRLQQMLRDQQELNSDLRQKVNNLEASIASMRATQEDSRAKKLLPEITDEEREQFGDDLIDLISRISKREVLPEVEGRLKDVDGRVKQVNEKVAHTSESMAESKRRETINALAAAVPNWEQQNEDPDFLDWLADIEPAAGIQRGRLLTDAFRSNDSHRVIWFFKSFHSENAAATTEAAPPKVREESQPKLDDYVAPGTPKTGTASAPNESGKRVWTRADIQRLYADKNEFVKKGKKIPDRLVKLERDLFKAQTEGRLR